MGISIKPEINQRRTMHALLKQYAEENEKLHKELTAARGKQGYYIDHQQYIRLQQDLTLKERTITQLREEVEVLSTQIEQVPELDCKVEQVAKVENSNVSKLKEFQFTFLNKLSEFCNWLAENGQDCTDPLASISGKVESALQMWDGQKADNSKFIDKLCGLFVQNLNELLKSVETDVESYRQYCTDEAKCALAVRQELCNKQRTVQETIETLKQQSLEFGDNTLTALEVSSSSLEHLKQRIQLKSEKQRSDMMYLQKALNDELMLKMEELEHHFSTSSDISRLLRSLEDERSRTILDMQNVLTSRLGATYESLQVLSINVFEKLQSMTEMIDNDREWKFICSMKEMNEEQMSSIKKEHQYITLKIHTALTVISEFVEKRKLMMANYFEDFLKNNAIERENASSHFDGYHQNVNQFKDLQKNLVSRHISLMEEHNECYQKCASTANLCLCKLMDQAGALKAKHEELIQVVDMFVSSELKDIPIDQTLGTSDLAHHKMLACISPNLKTPIPLPEESFEITIDSSFRDLSLNETIGEDKENEFPRSSKLSNRSLLKQQIGKHMSPYSN